MRGDFSACGLLSLTQWGYITQNVIGAIEVIKTEGFLI